MGFSNKAIAEVNRENMTGIKKPALAGFFMQVKRYYILGTYLAGTPVRPATGAVAQVRVPLV
jgi:hypothetical protein